MGIHTLHIQHVLLLVVYTILTIANSWLYKRTRGIQWFTLYSVCALMGAVAVAFRGAIPDFLSIVLGNLFVVAGYFFLFLSLAEIFGRKAWHLYLQAGLGLIAVLSMLQYGWLEPDTRVRLIFYSIVLACQQAHIALFVCRKRPGTLGRVGGFMALILGALCLLNLIRIAGVSLHGAPADYLQAGPFLASIVMGNACLQCGAMVAYVWMTAALLRHDLEVQASTDPLTGLLNRRAIELVGDRQIEACRRSGGALSAIILDLDNFKEINDSFGHHCGDAALIAVASCLRLDMRTADSLARIGGDEFAVLLPYTSAQAAAEIAERLRDAIQHLDIVLDGVHTRVTASLGLAQASSSLANWDLLLMACDKALYTVKDAGGNLALVQSGQTSRLAS